MANTTDKAFQDSVDYFKAKSAAEPLEKTGPEGYSHGWVRSGFGIDDDEYKANARREYSIERHTAPEGQDWWLIEKRPDVLKVISKHGSKREAQGARTKIVNARLKAYREMFPQ